MRGDRYTLPEKPSVPKHWVARMPHLVRDDGEPGNLNRAGRDHRCVTVNEWPAKGIGLSPSGLESLARLNPVPGRDRCMDARERHDGAISQDAAEGEHG